VAVTGATGFVGRHIAAVLTRRGHAVRALVRRPIQARTLASLGVELVPGDLADVAALKTLTRGTHAVVHLVGIIVEKGPATFHAVHVDGTRRLVEAARQAGIDRFVHMLAIGRAAGHPRPLVHMPLALARAAAGAFDLLGAAAPLTSDQLQMLVEGSATPANAIESVFGIRPIPFEQGLNRYLAPGRR